MAAFDPNTEFAGLAGYVGHAALIRDPSSGLDRYEILEMMGFPLFIKGTLNSAITAPATTGTALVTLSFGPQGNDESFNGLSVNIDSDNNLFPNGFASGATIIAALNQNTLRYQIITAVSSGSTGFVCRILEAMTAYSGTGVPASFDIQLYAVNTWALGDLTTARNAFPEAVALTSGKYKIGTGIQIGNDRVITNVSCTELTL